MHQRDMHEKGSQGETFSLRAILFARATQETGLKAAGAAVE